MLSIFLSSLIIFASATGLFILEFYSMETPSWQIQSVGQDVINLFVIVPLLIITATACTRDNKTACYCWTGTILYLVYTYAIYCFDIHFNYLFIIYCFILGLSFYSFLYGIFLQARIQVAKEIFKKRVVKIISVYFLVIALSFYLLWLSEIILPLVDHKKPISIIESGLFTNPVHVLDLSIILPGIFITSTLVIKKQPWGILLAPTLLVFFILMDITIGWLTIKMKLNGLESNIGIAIIMSALVIFSMILLILVMKAQPSSKEHKHLLPI